MKMGYQSLDGMTKMEKITKLCEDKILEPWAPSWDKFENEYLAGEKHFARKILESLQSSKESANNGA